MTLNGTFKLAINTGTTAVVLSDGDRLPAGRFVRVEALGVTLTIGGVELGGSVAVEQTTSATGVKRLTVAFTGLTVKFGTDTVLSGGSGALLILPDGFAGQFGGTVDLTALTGGTVTILGTFSLAINQTTRAVTESFEVNGQTITLNLPKGQFVRIAGTGVELSVAGQTLKGDFGFERSGTTTVLTAANVSHQPRRRRQRHRGHGPVHARAPAG